MMVVVVMTSSTLTCFGIKMQYDDEKSWKLKILASMVSESSEISTILALKMSTNHII